MSAMFRDRRSVSSRGLKGSLSLSDRRKYHEWDLYSIFGTTWAELSAEDKKEPQIVADDSKPHMERSGI
jgi:hypothetical protein